MKASASKFNYSELIKEIIFFKSCCNSFDNNLAQLSLQIKLSKIISDLDHSRYLDAFWRYLRTILMKVSYSVNKYE